MSRGTSDTNSAGEARKPRSTIHASYGTRAIKLVREERETKAALSRVVVTSHEPVVRTGIHSVGVSKTVRVDGIQGNDLLAKTEGLEASKRDHP